jgi:HAD superfamily hydrolase (TIGR01509 family)
MLEFPTEPAWSLQTIAGGPLIEAVIFDIDGTLIDSVDLHAAAWQAAFRYFGHEIPFERIRAQIGKGGDKLMPALLPQEEVAQRGQEIEQDRLDLFRREYLPRVKAFPRVRELFQRIKADGKRIALASSAKKPELADYQRVAGIEDLVDAETSSDDAEQSKPEPDIFHAVLDRLGGIDPRAVIVVGDTPYDAEAAAKAGLRTIGLLCGGWPEEKLRAANCLAIYRDPADLLRQYDHSPLAEPVL